MGKGHQITHDPQASGLQPAWIMDCLARYH